MAHTRLSIYNIALRAVGERRLTSISEDVESRRLLDEAWTSGSGAIRACLEQGNWHFAWRAVKIDAETTVDVDFGYSYVFTRPTDYVRLDNISADESFAEPLRDYEMERNYIYADIDPLYLRYVSDDEEFGGDLSLWPESFAQFVGHWMAVQIAPSLKSDLDMESLTKRARALEKDARTKDAISGPSREFPMGRWARARLGSGSWRRDGGPRGRLLS